MTWLLVFLLIGFWVLGLLNGYSLGGLIHILLVYAGLIAIARLIEMRRFFGASEHSEPVIRSQPDLRLR